MKKSILFRTNIIICIVIILGFAVTSMISYRTNAGIFQKNIEGTAVLASDGIYHKIDSIFPRPVNVSLTMANDSVAGVGVKADHLKELLKEYQEQYGITARLIDQNGMIQISSSETGSENVSLFKDSSLVEYREIILQNKTESETFWSSPGKSKAQYYVIRYIPNLKWHLIVADDFTVMNRQLYLQLGRNIAIMVLIIICVLFTITKVLRQYKKQILKLSVDAELEYHKLLHEATEGLYENIYELDITHNCACGQGTRQYFESLGIKGDSPYDQALKTIAQKQIKKDYIQGYLDIFSPQHVLEVYKSGINALTYDFLFLESPDNYRWMRINARIFYWASNQSIRMITYRQNIDTEKKREIMLLEKSQMDSLTGLYNKKTTEDMITGILSKDAGGSIRHAFIVFDIDNFKYINDTFGHTFGDSVIVEFAAELRSQFRDSDIVGRIGGDEFAAFMRDFHDINSVINKLERFSSRLNRKNFGKNSPYYISTSIGVSLFPDHGSSYSELYEKADQALYYTKGHGKGSYCVFSKKMDGDSVFHVNQQDMFALISTSIDGISKIAWVDGKFKMLYFNQKRTELTGTSAKTFSDADYDVLSQIHPDDLPGTLDIYYKSLPERVPFTLSYRLRHSDGHYIPVKANGLFVDEVYKDKYPVFYVVYTDMSSVMDFEITDKNL